MKDLNFGGMISYWIFKQIFVNNTKSNVVSQEYFAVNMSFKNIFEHLQMYI